MKKILLAGAIALSVFSAQVALADMAPVGQKTVTVCAEIKGLVVLPQLVVLSRESHVDQSAPAVAKVADGDCVDKSYKFNPALDLYAVDATYAATLNLQTYDPASDAKAYKASMDVDVTDLLVDPTSTLTFRHNEYVVAGVNNANHQMVLLSAGFKTNLEDQTMTPNFPSGLSSAIGSEVAVSGPTQQVNVFTDVTSDSPYYNALIYLKTNGVVQGYADGSFKPNATINRAEFTKIVVGASPGFVNNGLCGETFAKPDGTSTDMFTDIHTMNNNDWYFDYVCYAFVSKWINGYPDGTFRPASNINFVEAAKIISNALIGVNDNSPGPGAPVQPWYQDYVQTLADRKAIPRDIKYFSQDITRGQMAEIIYRLKTKNTTLSSWTYADLK